MAAESQHLPLLLLAIAGILVAAKVFHLIEKIKLPPVVGEILGGIFLGNLALIGFPFFNNFQHDEIIKFLAEIGVIFLLFQIGLESNVKQLLKVGGTAGLVAIIGAFVPFLLVSYVAGPFLLPSNSSNAYLFLGAALAATSVGITARIFKDLGKMKTDFAKVVIGAAVLDDIIGLVLLAVVSSLAMGAVVTPVNIGLIILKFFLFLVGSVLFGQLVAPYIGRGFAKIHSGTGSKFTLAISFCLVFAAIANLIGLEPIIGAFAAGLVLDPVHFKSFKDPELITDLKNNLGDLAPAARAKFNTLIDHHLHRGVDDVVEPLVLFFVPIFFVVIGMSVNILELIKPSTIFISLLLTLIIIFAKILSGLVAKKGIRLTVSLAMIPRGEVGLIFAAIGSSQGVISSEIFSIVVLTILLTTVIGPLLLVTHLQRKEA